MAHLSMEDIPTPNPWQPYPNPARDHWHVNAPDDAWRLRVTDGLGRILFDGLPPQTLDVSMWPSGIYMAEMQTKRGTFVCKWRVASF